MTQRLHHDPRPTCRADAGDVGAGHAGADPARRGRPPRFDLDKGIQFSRQDGSVGLAQRDSGGLVVIDYVTNREGLVDQRKVLNGVFEINRHLEDAHQPRRAGFPPDTNWSHQPEIFLPEDGAPWSGTVEETAETVLGGGAVIRHGARVGQPAIAALSRAECRFRVAVTMRRWSRRTGRACRAAAASAGSASRNWGWVRKRRATGWRTDQ